MTHAHGDRSPLEALAHDAQQAGPAGQTALINATLDAVLFAPSTTNPAESGFTPVVFDIDGTPHMVVFDTLEAAGQRSDLAVFTASLRGIDIARGLQPGNALLVYTRQGGYGIDAHVLDEVRRRDRARRAPDSSD